MADYIDKQKTLNVIFEIAENVIKSLPSADVVEVVRCKDCLIHGLCRFEQGLGLDGFCSQGKRKDD